MSSLTQDRFVKIRKVRIRTWHMRLLVSSFFLHTFDVRFHIVKIAHDIRYNFCNTTCVKRNISLHSNYLAYPTIWTISSITSYSEPQVRIVTVDSSQMGSGKIVSTWEINHTQIKCTDWTYRNVKKDALDVKWMKKDVINILKSTNESFIHRLGILQNILKF